MINLILFSGDSFRQIDYLILLIKKVAFELSLRNSWLLASAYLYEKK